MSMVDYTDIVQTAWKHYDAVLEAKIQHIHELTGVEKERLIKINPLEFITSDFIDKLPDSFKRNYQHLDLGEWVAKMKTPDTFLICPIDEDIETANQIAYKTGQTSRKLRAHKCEIQPITKLAAKRFFVKNHRQSLPTLSDNSVSYALVFGGEVVAVMTYDYTQSAIETGQAWVVERDFSLVRLVNCCEVRGLAGAKLTDLLSRGAVKVHVTANRTWVKNISIKEDANV